MSELWFLSYEAAFQFYRELYKVMETHVDIKDGTTVEFEL